MNVIHFSPHFPDNYYPFSVGLKQAGANALGIGDAPNESLRPELRGALMEYYRVGSMEDYDQVLRAVGYFTHRYGKMDRIDSFNEHWLDLEARIRTDFNLFGLRTDAIDLVKRKSRMKERFRHAGIAVARGAVVHDIAAARALIRDTGYPVVAKPDRGVGALYTYKIRNDAELTVFFRSKPDVEFIMEEFIDGEIMSFDGLADRDGKIVFSTGHAYMSGIMETVTEDEHIYYCSFRALPADLEEAGRAAVAAFDVRERFFHIEFFRTRKDGKIVALEVNMRPPGGYTTDMFNYANDIDIYQEWANVVVRNEFRATYDRKYHCCYIGRKNGKRYVRTHEQVVLELGPLLVFHTPVSGVFRSAIGDYGYLVRSASMDDVRKAIDIVHGTEKG
ncbi:MAG: ATP-grasp domain-containing protein [Nitrospirae bacterium]|nr:ATP-grasp domain-containing protein [Nitrospirota bacterium]NTW65309.1 ATP-grasp domain-containing protein [Nitrospirota bacterium]